jgi:hypothetical protein
MSWNGRRRRRSLRFCGSLLYKKEREREANIVIPHFVCGWNDVTDHWLLLVSFCCLFHVRRRANSSRRSEDYRPSKCSWPIDGDRPRLWSLGCRRTNDPPIVICTHTPGRNQMTGAVAPATTVSWQHYAIYISLQYPRRLCFMSNGACGVTSRNRRLKDQAIGEILGNTLISNR